MEPTIIELEDEGIDVEVTLPPEMPTFDGNIAEFLDDEDLSALSKVVLDGYETDIESRKDLEDTIVKAMDLLGLKIDDSITPFEGACTATHPLLMENVVNFEARAIQELVPANGPVKISRIGSGPEGGEVQMGRVGAFANYQLMHQVPDFVNDTERLLMGVGTIGTGIRKWTWDHINMRPDPRYVPLERLVVHADAVGIDSADRLTEIVSYSERTFRNLTMSGFFRAVDELPSSPFSTELTEALDDSHGISIGDDKDYTVLEQHIYYDFKGMDPLAPEGAMAPYIVHILKEKGTVLAIYRNWAEEDANLRRLEWYVQHIFLPPLKGFYGLGYMHIIGDLTKAATVIMRSLIDGGQFSSIPAGFKSKSFRIVGKNNDPLTPGEFRDVEFSGDDIRKGFMELPIKEPSQVLYQLLDYVVNAGQKFADATNNVIADSTNYGPVGTTLALLEASSRFYNSIHKRLHASMAKELKLLARLNYNYLPDTVPFPTEGGVIFREDFNPSTIDLELVSDPNMPSAAFRLSIAQALFALAQQNPQHFDMRAVLEEVVGAMNPNALQRLLPPPQPPQPADPLTDIDTAGKGQPITPAGGQDHAAHIAIKEAFLSTLLANPKAMESPLTQSTVQILRADIMQRRTMQFAELVMATGAQEEQAMAQAAQQVAQMLLQQLQQQMQPDAGREMVELEKQKLAIDAVRMQSQEVREDAKLRIKDKELDLKAKDLVLRAKEKAANSQLAVMKAKADVDKTLAKIEADDVKSQRDNELKESLARLSKAAKDD